MTLIFLLTCASGAAWSIKKFYESLNASLTKLNEKPIATITFKYKTAQRKFEERMIWDRLRQHSPVYDGDTIRTASESEATIYFEDGNIMDLGENTMAQVFFHDGHVETSVSGGTFVVNSSGASNGALIKTAGSSVVVNAGSSVTANVSDSGGTKFNVASGEVVFTDENGLARAIGEGDGIALDSNGDEQIIPLITVSSPSPNAKILAFSGSDAVVDFKWGVQNLGDGDHLVLETSRDKDFEIVEKSLDLKGITNVSVDLGEGSNYWRIYPKNAGAKFSAQSKVKVMSAPPPQLIAPESRSTYTYKTKFPDARFSWTSNDYVTAYDFEVADNPQMENPVIKQRTTTPSSIVSTLGTGTWYWRVTPFYKLNNIGLAAPSETRAFTITQRQKLDPPELILPAANEKINTALKDQINFSWKNNSEAVGYQIQISQDPNCYDVKVDQKAKANFFTLKPSETGMQTGTWYWRVTQFDGDGDISEQSEIRKFETGQVLFEQKVLYPPDNFVTVDTSLAELRFTWKTNIPGDNKFQIARDRNFTNLVVDEVNNDKFYQGADLSGGRYYWRISSADSPDQFTTAPRAFRVASQLANPTLVYPRQDQTLVLLGDSNTSFSWNPVTDADYYLFNCYASGNVDEPIASERLTTNRRSLDLTKLPDGNYSWSVQAGVDESVSSARRVSGRTTGDFKIVQLRKINLEYPANGAAMDGYNAMAYPDSLRWSCAQDLKQSVLTLSKNPNGYSNPIFTVQNPTRFVKLPRLEAGTYYWTVRGSNMSGVNASPDSARSFVVRKMDGLARPQLVAPADNKFYGVEQIRASRKIVFSWRPVLNATVYAFTLRNERGQVLLNKQVSETSYTLNDMADLKNGRFTYSVSAIQNFADGSFARRGDASSRAFTINLPAAADIVIDETGVLYGK